MHSNTCEQCFLFYVFATVFLTNSQAKYTVTMGAEVLNQQMLFVKSNALSF